MKRLAVNSLLASCAMILALSLFQEALQGPSSRPRLPTPFVFMAGWADNIGTSPLFYWNNAQYQAAWQRLLPYLTVVIGTTENAAFVRTLKAEGKLFAYNVQAPPHLEPSALQLFAAWSAPFNNTLKDHLSDGFDAICIDEFGFADGTERSKADTEALRMLRTVYPHKLILVYGAMPIADGGPTSLFGPKAVTYDDELNAINRYADLLLLENYQLETRPEKLSLFQSMPRNLESRSYGITNRTVYALYINQAGAPPADGDPKVNFTTFLNSQVDLVKRQGAWPRLRKGIGFWVMYRAKPDTVNDIREILKRFRGM